MRLRWRTAGESHGVGLVAFIDGICSGVAIRNEDIARDLQMRRSGAGRSPRQQQETDEFQLLAGVRNGLTTGAPIAVLVPNKVMGSDGFASRAEGTNQPPRTVPRPGHADLAGALKRPGLDLHDVAERASARETAARTVAGAIAAALLHECDIRVKTRVVQIGDVVAEGKAAEPAPDTPYGTGDKKAETRIDASVKEAESRQVALGGIFEVIVENVPSGLGDYTQWDLRLDGRLAQALMSIPAVKAVEIGEGREMAVADSSRARDPIRRKGSGLVRTSNLAGGIEGGVSNGMPITARVWLKPIPGVAAPVESVDLATGKLAQADAERHDVCVLRAAAVVGRAMTALVLADALLDRTGGDTLTQVKRSLKQLRDDVTLG